MDYSSSTPSFSSPDVPFYKSHFSEIVAVVVIILGALTLLALLGINLNEIKDKKVQKVVTIEKFEMADAICSSKNSPEEINSLCNQLTQKNCKTSSCCILLNGNKCVGGSKDGPTFHTENKKKLNFDYYYYKDKCFGDCPKQTN
jgi:hypothetical protein